MDAMSRRSASPRPLWTSAEKPPKKSIPSVSAARSSVWASGVRSCAEDLEREYGIPIANKRVSITPIAQIAACTSAQDLTPLAHTLDRAAETLGIDFLGGFSALVHKGLDPRLHSY